MPFILEWPTKNSV